MRKYILAIGLTSILLMANSEKIEAGLQLLGAFAAIASAATEIASGLHKEDLSPKAQRLYSECNEGGTSANAISSCDQLATMLYNGEGTPSNSEVSNKIKKIAFEKTITNCDNGDIKSCDDAINRHSKWYYIDGPSPYRSKIISMAEKACRGGMPKYCHSLGEVYEDDHNYKKAIEFYSIGCDYTDNESCERLKVLR